MHAIDADDLNFFAKNEENDDLNHKEWNQEEKGEQEAEAEAEAEETSASSSTRPQVQSHQLDSSRSRPFVIDTPGAQNFLPAPMHPLEVQEGEPDSLCACVCVPHFPPFPFLPPVQALSTCACSRANAPSPRAAYTTESKLK
jgi:hypothetical protein